MALCTYSVMYDKDPYNPIVGSMVEVETYVTLDKATTRAEVLHRKNHKQYCVVENCYFSEDNFKKGNPNTQTYLYWTT